MHPGTEALIQAVLDGEASERERRELEQLLESDPGARARFEELRELFDMLEGAQKLEPPPALASRVLANLPRRPAPLRRRFFDWLQVLSGPPPALRYAVAFSVGLALAIGVYELALHSDDPVDPLQAVGSLFADEQTLAPHATYEVPVALPWIHGSVRVGRLHGLAVLMFDLDSRPGVVLGLEGSGHGEVAGLLWFGDHGAQARIDDRGIWIPQGGRQRFALLLRDPEEILRLRFAPEADPGPGAAIQALEIRVPAAAADSRS